VLPRRLSQVSTRSLSVQRHRHHRRRPPIVPSSAPAAASRRVPAVRVTRRLSRCDLVMVDIPLASLRIARERAVADGLAQRCEIVAADAAALPFTDASFDAFKHSDVLCCTHDKLGVAVLSACRARRRQDDVHDHRPRTLGDRRRAQDRDGVRSQDSWTARRTTPPCWGDRDGSCRNGST
jgi:hypothetical protein